MNSSWTARVDWTRYAHYNEAELDELVDALITLSPALGLEHQAETGYPSTYSATITLEASSLRQATTAALQAVEAATSERATGVEVLATREFDRRSELPTMPDLVSNAEIGEILGVSRQRAAQLADVPGFPPAVAEVRSGGPLRIRQHVEAWGRNRQTRSGRPTAAVKVSGA